VRIFDATRPLREGLKVVARLLPHIDRALTAVVVAAAVVVAGAQVAAGVIAGLLIGAVAEGRSIEGPTLVLVVALPSVLLLGEAARITGQTVGQMLKRRVDLALRRRVLALSLDPVGIAHLEDAELQALQASARNLSPFTFTPGDAAVELTNGLSVRLQPLFAAAVLARYEPVLAVIVLAVWTVAHLMFVGATVRLVLGAASTISSPTEVYLRELVQAPAAAKELRVFGLGGWLGARSLAMARERLARSLALRKGQVRSYLCAGAVLGLGLFVGLAWVGVAAARSDLGVTGLAICLFALPGIFAVPNLFPDVPVMFGTFSVGAIDAAERAVRDRPSATVATPVVASNPPRDTTIRFRDVTFRYAASERAAVEHLDLDIPAGQRLAIVGLNGAGKTTLVKLLCRLYDPEGGGIEVGGVDIRTIDPGAWRGQIGVVFQDFVRWHLPVVDNLALRPDVLATSAFDARELAVADRAGLTAVVDRLPSGWATPLHSAARGGVDLSGGQWQRVALARGLLAVEHGASVLVLDEPTANLDPRAELEFFDAVLRTPLAGERPITTILISHRFATVRHADRIVVLDGGRVVEDGTHDELVAAGGRYYELFERQARSYTEAPTRPTMPRP
jgi:ATP-binding cassette subfamily B protein